MSQGLRNRPFLGLQSGVVPRPELERHELELEAPTENVPSVGITSSDCSLLSISA